MDMVLNVLNVTWKVEMEECVGGINGDEKN